MPAAMRIMHDRSIASFPKRSHLFCQVSTVYRKFIGNQVLLNLRRSANFGSRDSCVEDAVYHHRFETRAQLRYCIKVVSQRQSVTFPTTYNSVKYQANVISQS